MFYPSRRAQEGLWTPVRIPRDQLLQERAEGGMVLEDQPEWPNPCLDRRGAQRLRIRCGQPVPYREVRQGQQVLVR